MHDFKPKTRSYNTLVATRSKIYKLSADHSRLDRENAWYEDARKIIPSSVPVSDGVVYRDNKRYLSMQRIMGLNGYEYMKSNPSLHRYNEMLRKLQEILNVMSRHRTISKTEDFENMYLSKPCQSVDYFYEKYGHLVPKGTFTVNGKDVSVEPKTYIKEQFKRLRSKLITPEYSFIHGDLTLSNVVVDPNGDIFFIDPRGRFGSTVNFGDNKYDIAKLYFSSISNFDSYNNHLYSFEERSKNEYVYTIEGIADNPHGFEKALFDTFKVDAETIKFINITIWFSLFPHLNETDEHTFVAYLHGLHLIGESQ